MKKKKLEKMINTEIESVIKITFLTKESPAPKKLFH